MICICFDFSIWYAGDHEDDCTSNCEGTFGRMRVQGIIEILKTLLTFKKLNTRL